MGPNRARVSAVCVSRGVKPGQLSDVTPRLDVGLVGIALKDVHHIGLHRFGPVLERSSGLGLMNREHRSP